MRSTIISVIALAVATTTGMATAQDVNQPESNELKLASPEIDDSTPMVRANV